MLQVASSACLTLYKDFHLLFNHLMRYFKHSTAVKKLNEKKGIVKKVTNHSMLKNGLYFSHQKSKMVRKICLFHRKPVIFYKLQFSFHI